MQKSLIPPVTFKCINNNLRVRVIPRVTLKYIKNNQVLYPVNYAEISYSSGNIQMHKQHTSTLANKLHRNLLFFS